MGFLIRSILLLAILGCLGAGFLALRMVEDEPHIPDVGQMGVSDLRDARLFLENSDPRRLAAGQVSAFTLGERDIELLLDYALEQFQGGKSRVSIQEGRAGVDISARLPANPLGAWLNVQLLLVSRAGGLVLERLDVGGVAVPGWLADTLMRGAHAELKRRVPEYVSALDAINGYAINDREINVVYQWQPDLIERISSRGREFLVSAEDRDRLMAHARNLAGVTMDPELPRTVSLASFLGPVFTFAQLRGGDPVEENRAAILVMAMYVMGVSVPRVLGEPEDALPPQGQYRLLLSERHDFAQHFLVSAALAVSAGTGIADSIGILKELNDSGEGGSGFSFADIGADRTGVRFGELAVASADVARGLQEMLAGSVREDLFMAEFRDLPESLPEAEFEARFGGVDHPGYNRMVEDIDRRIDSMPLFFHLEQRL